MCCFISHLVLRLGILTFTIKNKNAPMEKDYLTKTAEAVHVIFVVLNVKALM